MKTQPAAHKQLNVAHAKKTNPISIRSVLTSLMLVVAMATSFTDTSAQSRHDRIAFGIEGGGNKYWGSFTDNQFAFSGDAFIRWNILDWLSLHVAYNGGQIHIKAGDRNVLAYPWYFGGQNDPVYPDALTGQPSLIHRDPTNVVRHGGWEAMLSLNVYPGQPYVPYVIGGIEYLNFEPRNQDQDLALPNNHASRYDKNVLGFVAGVGFEMYISDKITFNGRGLIHLTGTDWLDDYSSAVYPQDPNRSTTQDVFLTMGLGFSYYIFSPREEPAPTAVVESTIVVTAKPVDSDGDGLTDDDEMKVYHTDPHNRDTDGDGCTDGEEVLQYHTNPLNKDTDGDGLNDCDEIRNYHTDPLKADTDGDGCTDGQEVLTYHTDPLKADTDGDGLKDCDEINTYHTDPLKADTDGDRLNDGAEVNSYHTDPLLADTDKDGLSDGDEVNRTHTNPLDPDTDHDGFLDGVDHCPLTPGVAPDGCPHTKVGTIVNFPDILFIVNTDEFNFNEPSTLQNLYRVRDLVEQCPDLGVEVQGYASEEGTEAHNQELSERRARRIKTWLIEQGTNQGKIIRTVGFGEHNTAVPEPKLKKVVKKKGKVVAVTPGATPEQLEAARTLNRRVAIKVLKACK
ncbi:MAG TPA: OmpA family protein [Candidatus Kapabacteria bacterium]|nr:OmpA family protein [Candidatus Kapabacteria bacterium]